MSPAQAATEESARNASFQMFRNQGPDYFGDTDEMDAGLAAAEEAAQREGGYTNGSRLLLTHTDWERAVRDTAAILSLDDDATLPPYPEPSKPPPAPAALDADAAGKRKSPEPEEEAQPEAGSKKKKGGKAAKGKKGAAAAAAPPPPPPGGPGAQAVDASAVAAAQAAQAALAASFMSVFDAAALAAPVLPDHEEMGKILLERRKAALREEYGV